MLLRITPNRQAARSYLDEVIERAKLALMDLEDADVYDLIYSESPEEHQQRLIDGAVKVTEMIEQGCLSECMNRFLLTWVFYKGYDLLINNEKRAIQAQIKEIHRRNEEIRVANLVAEELELTSSNEKGRK